MIKKLIGIVLATGIMTINAQALDKKLSYDIINQCNYNVDKTGKYDNFLAGVLTGLAQGYLNILHKSGIDNDYAGLTPGEYSIKMCQFALYKRKEENIKTAGKYDVTQFYGDLQNMGYYMALPPTNDTNTTN